MFTREPFPRGPFFGGGLLNGLNSSRVLRIDAVDMLRVRLVATATCTNSFRNLEELFSLSSLLEYWFPGLLRLHKHLKNLFSKPQIRGQPHLNLRLVKSKASEVT